jgi:hypothetical protein
VRTTNDHVTFMLAVSSSLPTVNYYSTAAAHSSDHLLATNKIFYVLQISPTATCHSTLLKTQSLDRESPQPREDTSVQKFQSVLLTQHEPRSSYRHVASYTRTPSTDSAESKLRSRLLPTISTIRVKLEVITEVTVPKIQSSEM